MKKLLALLLALVMVFSFVACADDGWVDADDDDEESETTSEKKKNPTETVEVKTREEVETSGLNNNENNNQNNENHNTPGTVQGTKARLLGKWNAKMNVGSIYELALSAQPFSSYLDYDNMLLGGVTMEFKADGTVVSKTDALALQADTKAFLANFAASIDRYMTDSGNTYEAVFEMSKEDFLKQLEESTEDSFSPEYEDTVNTWSLEDEETLILKDENNFETKLGIIFEGDKMILTVDMLGDMPFFVCTK
ncbi:MAG: hypothetical protein IKC69_00715 [Clostridia bacterium]|nr:hypothetical protein [Clostridia bacterium]